MWPPHTSLYLVLGVQLSEEPLPVPQVVVDSVESSDIDVGQNPQTSSPHLQVHSWQREKHPESFSITCNYLHFLNSLNITHLPFPSATTCLSGLHRTSSTEQESSTRTWGGGGGVRQIHIKITLYNVYVPEWGLIPAEIMKCAAYL